MTRTFQSEVGALRRVVVKHARDAFVDPPNIERGWEDLGFLRPPDYERAVQEYDGFITVLDGLRIDCMFLPLERDVGLDSLYVRDASVVSDRGVVLCNMGKPARAGEPEAQEAAYRRWGIPIIGRVEGNGRLEGGDVVWLDDRTVAVGLGYRTNAEGARQFRALLPEAVEMVLVPLPHWKGPSDVFHLMSMLSPLDGNLALVHSSLMPVPFRQLLLSREVELVEAHPTEIDDLACNVLAVAPRVCVMAAGAPETVSRLVAAGVEVHNFEAGEICLPGSGGPTCLTRPLERYT
ncbi:MAG: hypothetical protein IH968_03120 [Gemmatimonadetes bacterium]|nr:hypothetical protein [Gemmatimonadota bacterium]